MLLTHRSERSQAYWITKEASGELGVSLYPPCSPIHKPYASQPFFLIFFVLLLSHSHALCTTGEQLLGGGLFEAPAPPQQQQQQQPAETPMKQRMQPHNPRAALEAPSPMPTWGGRKAMALRDASYGEALEVCGRGTGAEGGNSV